MRAVLDPVRHQGIRNALRNAFVEDREAALPEEMRRLLAKLR